MKKIKYRYFRFSAFPNDILFRFLDNNDDDYVEVWYRGSNWFRSFGNSRWRKCDLIGKHEEISETDIFMEML